MLSSLLSKNETFVLVLCFSLFQHYDLHQFHTMTVMVNFMYQLDLSHGMLACLAKSYF